MPSLRQRMNPAFKGIFFRTGHAFLLLLLMSIAAAPIFAAAPIALAVSGPPQQSSGPGGTIYVSSKVVSSSYGTGALKYYIFEPDSPKPAMAPLIAFLHGWGASGPDAYAKWIDQIVKRGNIVVFPVYQSRSPQPDTATPNAAQALFNSIEVLKSGHHVRPDLNKFAMIGHSVGGMIVSNIGALAVEYGLPVPRAIMSVEPGLVATVPLEDLSKIPADTLLLTIVGDRDFVVGDKAAIQIFYSTPQIGLDKKDFITMVSDSHGSPSLTADHFAPGGRPHDKGGLQSSPGVDALDYYCLWKLFDALTDAAFYGKNWAYALGNTPQQRYMGKWEDGTPVKELIVTDTP